MESLRRSPQHASAHDVAARYRRSLLNALGLAGVSTPAAPAAHPALAWAASGAMALTGRADGPPLLAPSCVATCADAVLQTFAAVTGVSVFDDLQGRRLLGERAAVAGHPRRGHVSVGDACRLLRARDGWLALNLARNEDVELIPAWLETDIIGDAWQTVERALRRRGAQELVARGAELGLALARLGETRDDTPWLRIAHRGIDRRRASRPSPLVIDLSSLWAGPLATHLLERAGARVIKVESLARPDGGRRGPEPFYDLLNARKESVALDFGSHEDRAVLDRLLMSADIVVEASRPRALRQLGFVAEDYLRRVPGLTWLSITGYGRDEPFGRRVAFGDDAAVSAGLVARVPGCDDPVFCADAIADPLTGLHAALAAHASWRLGGGRLLDVAMANVVAEVRRFAVMPEDCEVVHRDGDYAVRADDRTERVAAPMARTVVSKAAALGAHTRRVVEELC